MSDDKKVCVIGAGPSGIAACQALSSRGIPFDCFERGSQVGGLWRYENDSGLASAYESLHANTSSKTTGYVFHPMPDDFPDYPGHREMVAYLEACVECSGTADRIKFGSEVMRVERSDEKWLVEWHESDGRKGSYRYDAVLVATGHHWDPRWPEPALPGRFAGREMHSHHYRVPQELESRSVLVVGIGNSAMDIARDASRVAQVTYLSARSATWIVPRYVDGVPFDQVGRELISRTWIAREVMTGPLFALGGRLLARKIFSGQGTPQDYGLPAPDHHFGKVDPAMSSEIFALIREGRVRPKPGLSRFDDVQVHFEDGSVEEIDVVIYCTGYKITFPFLLKEIIDPTDTDLPLYWRVVHPDHKGLFFIGLIDVAGALNPLAELQAEWVADILDGSVGLPPASVMRQSIAREAARRRRRFGDSSRYAIHVDYFPYRNVILKERKRNG